MEERDLDNHLAITPLEHQNRYHGCCIQEWCMSPNFADSEEGTSMDRRGSVEKEKVKTASQVLRRMKDSRME